MINKNEAIAKARQHIAGWDFVDSKAMDEPVFSTRAEALAAGVRDNPKLRDKWLVGFSRIPLGHPLDEVFPKIVVIVDTETGETRLMESL